MYRTVPKWVGPGPLLSCYDISRSGYLPSLCPEARPETVMSRSGYVPKRSCPEVAMSRSGYVPKRSCPETVMSQSGYVPKRLCPETVMSRSGYVPKRSCSETVMSRNGYVPIRLCPEMVMSRSDRHSILRRTKMDTRSTDVANWVMEALKLRSKWQVVIVDNRWAVPHNPLVTRMYNAHINVEICNSIKSIQHICKYINKD